MFMRRELAHDLENRINRFAETSIHLVRIADLGDALVEVDDIVFLRPAKLDKM